MVDGCWVSNVTCRNKSDGVKSGLLGGHKPHKIILSSKKSVRNSLVDSAVCALVPTYWNQAQHSLSSNKVINCLQCFDIVPGWLSHEKRLSDDPSPWNGIPNAGLFRMNTEFNVFAGVLIEPYVVILWVDIARLMHPCFVSEKNIVQYTCSVMCKFQKPITKTYSFFQFYQF